MELRSSSAKTHYGLFPFDFLPKCTQEASLFKWPQFENFPVTLEEANQFLIKNTHLSVFSCESVYFRFRQGVVKDINRSDFFQHEDSIKPFVMGLRVWTEPRQDGCDLPQRIGYVSCVSKMEEGASGELDKITADINNVLRRCPIPGKIISVETIQIATGNSNVNFDASSWEPPLVDSQANFNVAYLTFIRIFYLFTAEIRHQEIGLADFFPAIMREGDAMSYPKVESFPDVLANLNRWANQLPSDIKLLNIQTIQTRAKKDGKNNAYNVFFWDSVFHDYHLRFLRAAYVISKDDQSVLPPAYFCRKINSKVISPGLVSDPGLLSNAKFEPPEVVKERLHQWVKKMQVNVVSVETLRFKVHSGSEIKEGFDGMHTWAQTQAIDGQSTSTKKEQFIVCFRVYFDSDVPEVDGFEWPRGLPDFWRENTTSCSLI